MTVDWTVVAAIAGLAVAIGAVAIGFYVRSVYTAPWFLLVGPADAEKTALTAGALETAFGRQRRSPHADNRDVAWHYFKDGVVIDVAGPIAFPAGGTDTTAWQRLLRLLRRYRPRRPIDGVILAIPAPLLLDADWPVRTQDLGAAVRERLTQAQNHFGFALPVYVVITHSDRVRGFTAFVRALPENLTQNMLGWSNPHAADQTYAADSIGRGLRQPPSQPGDERSSSCSRSARTSRTPRICFCSRARSASWPRRSTRCSRRCSGRVCITSRSSFAGSICPGRGCRAGSCPTCRPTRPTSWGRPSTRRRTAR